jgi:hypothetical protein
MGDRSCKRCSVIRVNTLCKAYEKAQTDNHPLIWHGLREVVTLVQSRGFDEGLMLLKPGLAGEQLRAVCWNVSSFLEDEEIQRIFGWLAGPKK